MLILPGLTTKQPVMAPSFYPSTAKENTISTSQKRKLRLSSVKKYAKSSPWPVPVLSFDPATTGIKTYPHPGALGWEECHTQ